MSLQKLFLISCLTTFIALVPLQKARAQAYDCNKTTSPEFQSGQQMFVHDDPRQSCSIENTPVDIENDKFLDWLKNAIVVCVDNPKMIYDILGDPSFIEAIAGHQLEVPEELQLDRFTNTGLDAKIVGQNRDYFDDPIIERLTNYFSDFNLGLSNAICSYEGISDPTACLEHLDACYEFESDCRENYFISTNTMQRNLPREDYFRYTRSRCTHIKLSLAPGALDEGSPVEDNKWLNPDEAYLNYGEICTDFPENYEDFKVLEKKCNQIQENNPKKYPEAVECHYDTIAPMISLERGFLVINRHEKLPATDFGPGLWNNFKTAINRYNPFRTIANLLIPDLQVIEFFIPGLVGATEEAKRELQIESRKSDWDRIVTDIETSTTHSLGKGDPNNLIIDKAEVFEKATYDHYEPLFDLINHLGLKCDSVEGDKLTQFNGGNYDPRPSTDTQVVGYTDTVADVGHAVDLPNTKEELLSMDGSTDHIYQAWMIIPKYFQHLDVIADKYLGSRLPKKLAKTIQDMEIYSKVILTQNNDPGDSHEVEVLIPGSCEQNLEYPACLGADPNCQPFINCEYTTTGIKTQSQSKLAGLYTPNAKPAEWKKIEHNVFYSKEWTDQHFNRPCYAETININYPGFFPRTGLTTDYSDANCAPNLNKDGTKSCNPVPTTPNQAACGIHERLGFNVGEGKVKGSCEDASNKPVTFLVNINAKTEEMAGYAQCYAKATHRIVRFTDIFADTDPSVLASAAGHARSVFNSSKDYLVIGNELNNLDPPKPNEGGEYNCPAETGEKMPDRLSRCGKKYADQFKAFNDAYAKGGGTVIPAPLDTYNTVYSADDFFAGANAKINNHRAYSDAKVLAANSYLFAANPDNNSYDWYRTKVGNKKFILTEYSLAPGEDTNLLAVKNHIDGTAPSLLADSDFIAITPLIRNVCGSGGWLRYNCIEFVNRDGDAVPHSDSPGTGGSPDPGGGKPGDDTNPRSKNRDINRIADEYKVPPLFLEAIWAIESLQSPGGCDPINEGGHGSGPMGIADITWDQVDPGRTLDRCELNKSFELAARVLVNWKAYDSGITYHRDEPNHPDHPTVTLSDMTTVGRYYRGTLETPCTNNTATNNRWGMSYCDAVQYYINNGQTPPKPGTSVFTPLINLFNKLTT